MNPRIVKQISLTTIFAAVYSSAVVALAPISFNVLQVRVADAMLSLAVVFGWPSILGIALGTVIANFFGGLGIIDVLGGTAANFVAALLAWRIGRTGVTGSWICAITVEVVTVTLIVGTYLSYLLSVPILVGISGVLVGSVVSIGILGYMLLKAISKLALAEFYANIR